MSSPRCALVGLAGSRLEATERAGLRRLRPAGVLLFARNVRGAEALRELIGEVRATLAGVGVEGAIVAVDQEGGVVTPFDGVCAADPSPASLGWADSIDLTQRVHAERASVLRGLGVDLVLAPLADVDRAGNPVIATRAFGGHPATVAAHVEAAVRGLHQGGVRACAKHWPGHGSPRLDSHLDLPELEIDEATRLELDAPPFRAAVRAGVDAMMLAHLHVPAWSPGVARPVGVDPQAVQRLRHETGFTGPLLSDAVEMKGLAGCRPLALVEAGMDLVLFARPVGLIGPECEELPERPVPWGAPRLAGSTLPAPRAGEWAGALHFRGAVQALRDVRRVWVVDAASGDRLLRIPDDPGAPLEGGCAVEVDVWRELLPGHAAQALPIAGLDTAVAPPWTTEDAVVVLAVRPLAESVEGWISRGARPRVVLRFGAAALHRELPSEVDFALFSPEIRTPPFRRILRARGGGGSY